METGREERNREKEKQLQISAGKHSLRDDSIS